MRRLVVLVAILALALPVHGAVDQQFVYSQCAAGCTGTGLTAASGSTTISFGFSAKRVIIRSDEAAAGDVLFVDFAGSAATSADIPIYGTETWDFQNGSKVNQVKLLCSANACLLRLVALN